MIGRLKFDLNSLANEMLDHLPPSLFTSTTATFLDPCMGGGQFVKAIEDRLRAHGHSDDNIAERVFGVESNQLRVSYAVNKHRLVGQYVVRENYLEYNEQMKIDCVIGNPPYQGRKENSDSALWSIFVNLGFDLLSPTGILVFITPTTWVGNTSKSKKANYSVFIDNHVKVFKRLSNEEKVRYFSTVGSSFGYYVLARGSGKTEIHCEDGVYNKQLQIGEPLPNTLNSITLSIHDKLANIEKICVENNFECHGQKLKNKNMVSDYNAGEFQYKTYYSHNLVRWSSIRQSIFDDIKVMIPNVSTLGNAFLDKDCNFSQDIFYVVVSSIDDGNNLVALMRSTLFTYISKQYRQGRNLGYCLKFLPKVDLTRTWTDAELYEHFGLTQEEIDYIEANTK
jgi:site-specific DNA-methyltransferase (adenine-specific)